MSEDGNGAERMKGRERRTKIVVSNHEGQLLELVGKMVTLIFTLASATKS